MNIDLESVHWSSFLFPEIFDIKKGFYNKKPNNLEKGEIPFLGATAVNNGITGYYSIEDIELNSKTGQGKNHPLDKKMFEGNCIVVTNNGSVGYAYYQKTAFTCSHDVNPLYLKHHMLNEYIAKFLISVIEKQRVCFEYARKWRPERMKKSKLMLPITDRGEPNYKFMEDYILQKEQEKLAQYQQYLSKKMAEVENVISAELLEEKKWEEYYFDELFLKVESSSCGIDKNKLDRTQGIFPYVTRSDNDNGIHLFISKQKDIFKINNNNVITIGLDTQTVFYQPFKFYTGQNIQILWNSSLNNYIALFLIPLIKVQMNKFNWGGNGATLTRLRRCKILLPANSLGRPDYEYMENYIKILEYKKVKAYMDCKKQDNL